MHYFPRSCAAFVLLTPLACGAFDTSRIEDTEVRECADRALPSATARQIQQVEVVGKSGHSRLSLREIFWTRSEDNDSRVLVRVLVQGLQEAAASLSARRHRSLHIHTPIIQNFFESTYCTIMFV